MSLSVRQYSKVYDAHHPFIVGARWFRLIEVRGTVWIEAANDHRNAKWSATSRLRVALFGIRDKLSNVADGSWVFDGQFMRLALDARHVDEYTSIGRQACILI